MKSTTTNLLNNEVMGIVLPAKKKRKTNEAKLKGVELLQAPSFTF